MSNYLKKSLFTLLVLTVPYMNSASKAMDIEDYDGSTIRTHKVSFEEKDQQEVQSFTKYSDSSQVVSLEDSQNSWASYLISPVKATFQTANEFIDLATRNPKLAMVVGVAYTLQLAEALPHCACYCCKSLFECGGVDARCYGYTNSIMQCQKLCTELQLNYARYIWNATKC